MSENCKTNPQIYIVNISDKQINPKILRNLPQDRISRIKKSVRAEKSLQMYVAELLIHFAMLDNGCTYSSVRRSENGKPYSSQIFFNVSHSKDYVVLGINPNNEIGIDIQSNSVSSKTKEYFEKIGKQEYLWEFNRKEAFLKCIGTGWKLKAANTLDVKSDLIGYKGDSYFLNSELFRNDYFLAVCDKNEKCLYKYKEISVETLEEIYEQSFY